MMTVISLSMLVLAVGLVVTVAAATIADWIDSAHDETNELGLSVYQPDVIEEVRWQQNRAEVVSRNRHLIVGQEMRRRGELVWPWEPDTGQGDA